MTNLMKWDPLREFRQVTSRLSDVINRGASCVGTENDRETLTRADWLPVVDIAEDEAGYHIDAELPGVKKEDLKVSVENGVLTIRGERKFEREEKSDKVHRVERSYGSFLRTFRVPEDADGAAVNAKFKDGLLSVVLPKAEEAKPKQIEVQVD